MRGYLTNLRNRVSEEEGVRMAEYIERYNSSYSDNNSNRNRSSSRNNTSYGSAHQREKNALIVNNDDVPNNYSNEKNNAYENVDQNYSRCSNQREAERRSRVSSANRNDDAARSNIADDVDIGGKESLLQTSPSSLPRGLPKTLLPSDITPNHTSLEAPSIKNKGIPPMSPRTEKSPLSQLPERIQNNQFLLEMVDEVLPTVNSNNNKDNNVNDTIATRNLQDEVMSFRSDANITDDMELQMKRPLNLLSFDDDSILNCGDFFDTKDVIESCNYATYEMINEGNNIKAKERDTVQGGPIKEISALVNSVQVQVIQKIVTIIFCDISLIVLIIIQSHNI